MSEYGRGYVPPEERINMELERLKEEPLLAGYEPTFLGRGYEQVVFNLKDHKDTVVKVPVSTLERSASGSVDLDRLLEQDREANRLLREHFGDMVLP